jgi:hypothetical protein
VPATGKATSVSLDAGLPGLPAYLIRVFATKDGPLGPPTGSPGKYRALFTLQRPGFRPLSEREVTEGEHIVGDSHLAMAKPAYAPPGNENARHLEMGLILTPEKPS